MAQYLTRASIGLFFQETLFCFRTTYFSSSSIHTVLPQSSLDILGFRPASSFEGPPMIGSLTLSEVVAQDSAPLFFFSFASFFLPSERRIRFRAPLIVGAHVRTPRLRGHSALFIDKLASRSLGTRCPLRAFFLLFSRTLKLYLCLDVPPRVTSTKGSIPFLPTVPDSSPTQTALSF